MGSSADAQIYFGYLFPEIPWDEDREDEDMYDMEYQWFKAHAPEEIKALDLTREEHAAWNALPYYGGWGVDKRTPEQKAAYADYSARYSVFSDARREWLRNNSIPADTTYIGSYEGEDRFLALCDDKGNKIGVRANWEALPLDFADKLFKIDAKKAKKTLDSFLTGIGIEPPKDMPQWHLIPLYG